MYIYHWQIDLQSLERFFSCSFDGKYSNLHNEERDIQVKLDLIVLSTKKYAKLYIVYHGFIIHIRENQLILNLL